MNSAAQIEHTLHNLASPKRGHTFWGLLVVLLLAFGLTWAEHHEWLKAPNEYMLTPSPDGFKNYMTAAWHVRYDSSYVHYSGMDYPFGEHVLFTDNQPIVSAAMQWWNNNVFDISGNVIGIMNVLMILSIVLGAGVIYLLLRKLHLPVWYAGGAALAIAFLSPQHIRMDGHFGLSHIWVIPLLLLLLCRYEERRSRRYQSLLIGLLIWFAAQLHFYNFGVSAIFLGFYTIFQILMDRSWRNIWTRFSHLAVMVVLPFALLNIWLHWSDYCPDRPANPYGFTTYIGSWEGVFLPYEHFPLHKWIEQFIIRIREVDFEAQAYAGVCVFVFTLWLIFKRRFRPFEAEWDHSAYHRVHKNYLYGICFAGFAIMLFALGFPFAIKGMEWMVDLMGPLRQFRGLGRFTWAFYYAFNVLVFYVLWNKSVRLNRSKPWRLALAVVPLLVMSWEAWYFQAHRQLPLNPNQARRSVVANSPDHWLNKVDFARFQALMPLPYYHVGSENIWLDPNYNLFQKVQATAYQTGVPDMGVNMSRSAVGRMLKSVQFAFNPCEPPALLSDLPDTRPIALMIEPSQWDDVKSRYPHLVEKAGMVYDGPNLKIMSLVPDSVRSWSYAQAKAIAAEMDATANMDAGNGWRCARGKGWFVHQDLNDHTDSRYKFQGAGAGEANMKDTVWIWKEHIPKGYFYYSVWIKVDEDMGMTHEVKIIENNRGDGHEVHFKHEGLRFYLRTIVDGWALFDVPFEVYEDDSNIRIFMQKKGVNAPFWYDEVTIKNAGFTLYRKEDGWIRRDCFWYKLPKN